jgi:hypothetical protein
LSKKVFHNDEFEGNDLTIWFHFGDKATPKFKLIYSMYQKIDNFSANIFIASPIKSAFWYF